MNKLLNGNNSMCTAGAVDMCNTSHHLKAFVVDTLVTKCPNVFCLFWTNGC